LASYDKVDDDWKYHDAVDQGISIVVFWPYGEGEYRHLGYSVGGEIKDAVLNEIEIDKDASSYRDIRPSRYQIGPTAEWFPTYILTFYENVRPLINDGASLIGWADLVVRAVSGARRWSEGTRVQLPENASVAMSDRLSRPLLSIPAIEALCFKHLRDNYHPRARVLISSSTRSTYEPYGSAQHPSGHETHTIQLDVGKSTYVYIVDSRGMPIEHYRLKKSRLEPLTLPDWFHEEMQELGESKENQPYRVNG